MPVKITTTRTGRPAEYRKGTTAADRKRSVKADKKAEAAGLKARPLSRLESAPRKRGAVAPVALPSHESYDDARRRKEIAAANIAELELASRRGKLVNRDELRVLAIKTAALIVETHRDLPARVEDIVRHERDPDRRQRKLHALLEDARRSMSEALARWAEETEG